MALLSCDGDPGQTDSPAALRPGSEIDVFDPNFDASQMATVRGSPGSRRTSRSSRLDFSVVESEAAVLMLMAEFLEIVRRKIDDQYVAAITEDTCGIGDHAIRCVRVVQHLMNADHVEGGGRVRQLVHIGKLDATVAEIPLRQMGPRNTQHVMRAIDAFGALEH